MIGYSCMYNCCSSEFVLRYCCNEPAFSHNFLASRLVSVQISIFNAILLAVVLVYNIYALIIVHSHVTDKPKKPARERERNWRPPDGCNVPSVVHLPSLPTSSTAHTAEVYRVYEVSYMWLFEFYWLVIMHGEATQNNREGKRLKHTQQPFAFLSTACIYM